MTGMCAPSSHQGGTGPADDPTGQLSRRQFFAGAALAAAASTGSAAARTPPQGAATGSEVNIRLEYKALVRRKADGGPAAFEKVKLRPFGGRQVLVRLTATQCCYSEVAQVIGGWPQIAGPDGTPIVCGHQGIGVVEAIGSGVRSVEVGDTVYINVTANCGWCYNCVRGRADVCLANRLPNPIIGDLMDGTPVMQDTGGGGIGGMSEYTVNYEERLTPVWTRLSHEELAVMNCVGSTGMGMTSTLRPAESGSSVVIFGAGPIGLGAVQGARIQAATQIIAVEPIKQRREMALRMGATAVVDPNEFGDKLVARLRQMTRHTPVDRLFSGARDIGTSGRDGPDYVIEAVGRQQAVPKVEQGPDPTGVQVLQQAWELIAPGGYGLFCGFGYRPDDVIKFPAQAFTAGSRTIISAQGGGVQPRRDLPRYTQLMETGKFDAKSFITKTYKFADIHKAYQDVADRTVISTVVTF